MLNPSKRQTSFKFYSKALVLAIGGGVALSRNGDRRAIQEAV
jgi:hypothetical protein